MTMIPGFNVIGEQNDEEGLRKALDLMLHIQANHRVDPIVGYKVSPEYGLVMLWDAKGGHLLPSPCGVSVILPMALSWLKRDETWDLHEFADEEKPHIGDGTNVKGWHLYTGDYGSIGVSRSLGAIKPHWIYYGK